MGRAILAKLPEEERDYLLRALRDREPQKYAEVERGVKQAVHDLETRGFVTSFGAWRPDVNAIGVPVYSLDRERLFAMICGGPSFTVSADYLIESVAPRLVRIAKELSATAERAESGLAAD